MTRKEKDRIRFKARRKEVRREAAALIRQRKAEISKNLRKTFIFFAIFLKRRGKVR